MALILRRVLALTALLALLPIGARAQVKPGAVIGPVSYTFSGNGQSTIWTCNSGQASFQFSMPSGMTGAVTLTVAQKSSGPFLAPAYAFAGNTPASSATLTNSGSLTIALNSNLYVQASVSAYTSGSVTVTGTCTSAPVTAPPPTSLTATQSDGTQLHTDVDALPALPAGSNTIGGVTLASGSGQNSTGSGAFIPVCDQSVAINVSANATTQLIAAPGSGAVHICHVDFLANGATPVTFESGTGTNCGTGTAARAGPYPLTAQTGLSAGDGIGVLWSAPSASAVCIVNGAAVQVGGVLTYGIW